MSSMGVFQCGFYSLFFYFTAVSSSSSSLHPLAADSAMKHRNHTGISEFRLINRRSLLQCPEVNPYLQITVIHANSTLSDEEYVTVNVTGILIPSKFKWVAMITPSSSDVSSYPLSKALYAQTGDLRDLPLLRHYPVKAQYLSNDPDYLSCRKKECKQSNDDGVCLVTTCSASLSFHVINLRTDIEFVLFTGGFVTPCVLKRTSAVSFANPKQPLYGHLSSIDSTGTSMRVTWISGDGGAQQVQYKNGSSQTSQVTTFSQDDMCSSAIPSPAKDFGWHDPGYIHSAVMTGLQPSTTYTYKYGSDSAGWSNQIQFRTPPAGGGSDELRFLAFGDMGKAPKDASVEHYIQPGSISVIDAMTEEVNSGKVDSIFHIGDISYATGFLVEWDFFLHLITPLASHVSYMTATGNHENYVDSGSVYVTPDSGGECGVPYETYFQMPTPAKDKPWYSIEQGSVHFTVISTEHDWSKDSEQYLWMKNDMASVDRSRTPWLVFTGHRPMYTSSTGVFSVDYRFIDAVEPLLLDNKVDLILFGHVHNYERTCSVYQSKCTAFPFKDQDGIDVYDHRNYSAPVQAVIGMAGFTLDGFPDDVKDWSLIRISKFGYLRGLATRQELKLEFVNAQTKLVEDSFRITG
ncbi:hypothetical protein SAY86_010040 [Trapa natans]|uniref:Purple acid phosphatase n=1 Tax=Trapa natans TaxID=22666 RepID=A0AAN7L4Z7_TRANT|nr:hypothetical protein SAY86_010040 [Trapa natans]